jgi:hypothetical protein
VTPLGCMQIAVAPLVAPCYRSARVLLRGFVMRRFALLLCALLLVAGCFSDGDKAQWREAMKDLRGENMRMRSAPEVKSLTDR